MNQVKNIHGQYNSSALYRLSSFVDASDSVKAEHGQNLAYNNITDVDKIRESIKFDLGDEFSEWYDAKTENILSPKLPFDNCFFSYECGNDEISYGVHLRNIDGLVVGDFLYSERDWKSFSPTPTVCREVDGQLIVSLDAREEYSGEIEHDMDEMRKCRIALTGVLKAIEALNCSNIITVEHKPTRLKKAKADKKGKTLFKYHTLQITNAPKQKALPGGGTHASPRVHLRRGHIRNLPNGSTTWVQPCVVGDRSRGMVHKDYSFRAVH